MPSVHAFLSVSLTILGSLVTACQNQAEFVGDHQSKLQGEGSSFQFDCGDQDTVVLEPNAASEPISLKGDLCPQSQGKLKVLFMVDYSLSMGPHQRDDESTLYPGSDPFTDGTCGRFKAAKAIIETLKTTFQEQVQIEVGMIPFAADVVTEHQLPLTPLEAFHQNMSASSFCAHITDGDRYGTDRENPGAIDYRTVSSNTGTNFAKALQRANDWLKGDGKKLTYFISDGYPTIDLNGLPDDDSALADGVRIADLIRRYIPNHTFNGLLLGPPEDQVSLTAMTQVAGDPTRVRHAHHANQLADEILKFPPPIFLEGSAQAQLSAGSRQMAIEIDMHAVSQEQWSWETQPFELLSMNSQVLSISARSTDGATYQRTFTIDP